MTGCLPTPGGDGTENPSNAGITGEIQIKKIKARVSKSGSRDKPSRVRGQVNPNDISSLGIQTMFARVTHELTKKSIEKQTPYLPGGVLKLESVPIGNNILTLEGRDSSGAPLLQATVQVNVKEGPPAPLNSLTLLEPTEFSAQNGFIQDFSIVDKTENSVFFFFLTAEPAITFIEYQEIGGPLQKISVSSSKVTNHQGEIPLLEKGKSYQARPIALNSQNGEIKGTFFQFDLSSPIDHGYGIALSSGSSVTSTNLVSFTITGDNGELNEMILQVYLEDQGPPNGGVKVPFKFENTIELPDVEGKYILRVRLFEEGELVGEVQATLIFDKTPLQFLSVKPGFVSLTFAEIDWVTNKPTADAYVEYRLKDPLGPLLTEIGQENFHSSDFSVFAKTARIAKKGKSGNIQPHPTHRAKILKSSSPRVKKSGKISTQISSNEYFNYAVLNNLQQGKTYQAQVFIEGFDLEEEGVESAIFEFTTEAIPLNFNFTYLDSFGISQGDLQGQIAAVGGIHSDGFGYAGYDIFVSDSTLGQINIFNPDGNWVQAFGSGTLINPMRLAATNIDGKPAVVVHEGDDDTLKFFTYENYNPIFHSTTGIYGGDLYLDIAVHPYTQEVYALGVGGSFDLEVFNTTGSVASQEFDLGSTTLSANGINGRSLTFITDAGYPVGELVIGYGVAGPPRQIEASGTGNLAYGGTWPGGIDTVDLDYYPSGDEIFFISGATGTNQIGKFTATGFNANPTTQSVLTIPNSPYNDPSNGGTSLEASYFDFGDRLIFGFSSTTATASVITLDTTNFSYLETLAYTPGNHPEQSLAFTRPHFDGEANILYLPKSQNGGVAGIDPFNHQMVRTLKNAGTGMVLGISQNLDPNPANRDLFVLGNNGTNYLYRYLPGDTLPNNNVNLATSNFVDVQWGTNHKVYVVNSAGYVTFIDDLLSGTPGTFGTAGSGDGQLNSPSGIGIAQDDFSGTGNLIEIYIADTGNHRIVVFDDNHDFFFQFGTQGSGNGQFNSPTDVYISDYVYIVDSGNQRIVVTDYNGGFLHTFGVNGSGPGEFLSPQGITSSTHPNSSQDLFISDNSNNQVLSFSP